MRIIVLLFLILINYSLNSQLKFPTDVQQAYLLSYKIENAFNNAEYHKCINLLIQKKNLQAPYNEFDYLYYSKSLLLINDTVTCVKMLNNGIENGLFWDEGSRFTNLISQKEFSIDFLNKYVKQNYLFHHSIHERNLDTTTINLINKLVNIDQMIRSTPQTDLIQWGENIQEIDSINFTELKQIFSKYNNKIPPRNKIGRDAINNITLILHHVSYYKKYFEECSNLIFDACVNYEVHPSVFAGLYDRISLDEKKCAIYGVMPTYHDGKLSIILCECKKVDKLRLNIGLNTLKEFSIERQIELPKCYKNNEIK
jgi:hypothetical protein